jgi:hypothetical protein
MTQALLFIASVFAVWRLSYLISEEDGPFDIVFVIRKQLGNSVLGDLMDCFYCVSVWFAFPFAILFATSLSTYVVFWLGISGGACIINKVLSNV